MIFGKPKPKDDNMLENIAPKATASHELLRQEVINTREVLLRELEKLNKKFDLNYGKKNP